jgi:hypothetical protein
MKKSIGIIIFTVVVAYFFVSPAFCQNIERKIIVEDGMCYYTTIDPEFQLATLHVFAFDKPVKTAKAYAVPAGRNLNIPIIPFSWDLMGKDLFVINFMNNALNNRRNAIKRIPMNLLNEWDDKLSISDVVMKSTEIRPYTWFEPYSEATEKSPILNHFFFDGIATSDSSLCIAVSNNGELTMWEYSNGKWKKGEDLKMQTDDFFSLFIHKGRPYLVTSDGKLFAVQNNTLIALAERKISQSLASGFLIINKTDHTVLFMEKEKFDQKKSMTDMVKQYATNLFL